MISIIEALGYVLWAHKLTWLRVPDKILVLMYKAVLSLQIL